MAYRLEQNGSDARLVLCGDLTVAAAAEGKEAMLEAVDVPGRLAICFDDVAAADASCVQLICAAHRERMRSGGRETVFAGRLPERLSALAHDLVPCHDSAETGNSCLIRGAEHHG
jgi:hypothetical protein